MWFVTFLDQQNFDLFSTHLIYIQLSFQAFLFIVGAFLFICYHITVWILCWSSCFFVVIYIRTNIYIFVLFYLLNIFSPAVTSFVVNAKVHTKHILFWLASSRLVTRLNFVTFFLFSPFSNLRIHVPTRAPNSEPGSLIGGWICVSFSDWCTAQTHTLPMWASCERPSACFSASLNPLLIFSVITASFSCYDPLFSV